MGDLNENIENAKNIGKLELESTSSFQTEELEKSGVLENQSVTFGNFSNSEIKELNKSNTKIGKLELESTSSFQTQELESQNVTFGNFSRSEIMDFEKNSTKKMDVLQR